MRVLAAVFIAVFASTYAMGATLVLEGDMNAVIEVDQDRTFTVPSSGLKRLTFRFASPVEFKTSGFKQGLRSHSVKYTPKPDSVKAERDHLGNTFTVVEWRDLKTDATVSERFTVALSIDLSGSVSRAPFPLKDASISRAERRYLEATSQVEVTDPRIKELAASLTAGAQTEQAAVMSVLNWVVDKIKYKTPIPKYGAVWTLERKYGNCQNFSHISIALLRASGIPARIVGGIALGKSWRVPLSDGALLQSIGQGGHAWIEVWYPDLGWLPYDAQQSHLFVGPRHIKQTVGLDSNDINDSWRASPTLPPYNERIGAEYVRDDVNLVLLRTIATPQNYIMTSSMAAKAAPVAVKPPAVISEPSPLPAVPPALPAVPKPAPRASERAEFGNLDFPTLMDFYVKTTGDVGRKTFDKETSEYVTGDVTYAQAFSVTRPLRLDTVSLAMHKFGGRLGSLWIDVVKDDRGRPGMEGVRSVPLALDTVRYAAGYKWFDFGFALPRSGVSAPVLAPGKYWIILRRSSDAIVSWFYVPGNRYGGPDDARSTARGINWSNVMNFDFNFKVQGLFVRDRSRP